MVPPAESRRTPRPRSWIADPIEQRSFGRVKQLSWRDARAGTYEATLIRAAYMQHQISLHVHRVREARVADGLQGWTFAEVAENRLRSVDYHGLMRLLRGDVPMGLHHTTELGALFGFALSTPWDSQGTDSRGNQPAGRPSRR